MASDRTVEADSALVPHRYVIVRWEHLDDPQGARVWQEPISREEFEKDGNGITIHLSLEVTIG